MKTRAITYVILAGIFWGTSGIFVNLLSPYGFTSYQMTAVRAIVSFICMLAYTLIKDRSLFKLRRADLLIVFSVGATMFLTANLYYASMQMTSVSTAVVLMYTAPIYVAVFSSLFLGERLSRTSVAAIACMLVGCGLVSGIIGGIKFDLVGIIIGVLSGITYAAYNILTKIAVGRGTNPVSVTLYSFGFMSVISLILLEPKKMAESISTEPALTIPLLVGLGIFTYVVPYFLYTLGMRDLPAATATALGTVEPMSATLFSVIIFNEVLDLFSIIGIILIILAIVITGRGAASNKYKKDKEETEEKCVI